MKPPKRKRVSETFERTVYSLPDGTRVVGPLILLGKFKDRDRVRVKVTKLERGK